MKKLLLYFLFWAISFFCFLLFSNRFLKKETQSLAKAEVIVVLGYPSLDSNNISPIQKTRVDKAIQLYNNDYAKKILFSGGAVQNKFIEAETMKSYALKNGIPNENILIETESKNTEENIELCYNILAGKNISDIIVITSKYHTKRSNYIFSQYPLNVQMQGTAYPNEFGPFRKTGAILIEYLGFLRYFIKGGSKSTA